MTGSRTNVELERTTTIGRIPEGIPDSAHWSDRGDGHLPLSDTKIVNYFREHPETALLVESYDKRFTPSTFIVRAGDELSRVGWFTKDAQYQCIREFSNLAEAETDCLLFSLGKSRWAPQPADDLH